mgnify:CR=1 FL=1
MNTLLGQRIREQRKEKGWTIEQFAERVELSANYVGDLERGVKIPNWKPLSESLRCWVYPQMCLFGIPFHPHPMWQMTN